MNSAEHKLVYSIGNEVVTIMVPDFLNNYNDKKLINLESFRPMPSELKNRISCSMELEEFRADINTLMPNTKDGNLLDNSFDGLFIILQNHLNKYGRILPSDLFTYIDETIIMMIAVSEQIYNIKIGEEEAGNYFKIYFLGAWSAFPEELRGFLLSHAENEPMTNYVFRALL